MKLKILILIAGTAIVGSSITIAVIQSRDHRETRQQRQAHESQNRIGTAISNYNQTFKLNTNPPIWPEAHKKQEVP